MPTLRPITRPIPTLAHEAAVAMTDGDFADWLSDDLLYIKPVISSDGVGYAVYAGDGTFLDIVTSIDEVVASADHHDMSVAAVH